MVESSELEPATSQNRTVSQNSIKEIYELLKKGEQLTKLCPGGEIVLLLGNTGSGKSTLGLFLTGETLKSEEVGEDTGEFIIVDSNQRISGNATILSQTIFPELLSHPTANTTFYDCPGFSDTRSAAHEIAATYFIRKVIDAAKSVKLVFVVNHTSVRRGRYRNDFIALLEHLTVFIRNVKKYKDSISLIATKVDISLNRGKIVPDEKVIAGVATFLEQVKSDIESEPAMPKKFSNHLPEVLALLESLLIKEEDSYPRIGIFRSPNEPGKLSEIELLKVGKTNMEAIITKNIRFVEVKESDFGYTVSSDAKLFLDGLIEQIYNDIIDNFVRLGNEMERLYEQQESKMTEISMLQAMFKTLHESFLKIQQDTIKGNITTQDFQHQIYEKIDSFSTLYKTNISFDYRTEIKQKEDYIKFLRMMRKSSTEKDRSAELATSITTLVNHVQHSRRYYEFLNHLYLRLSEYDVQHDKTKYFIEKIGKIRDIGDSSLNLYMEAFLKEYSDILNIELHGPKLKLFKQILALTLNHEVESTCSTNAALVVKGQYIKLSEVDVSKCGEGTKNVYVFALEKVFIDTSLDLTGREVQLAIVAPVWEVLGTQYIKLDGKPGRDPVHYKARDGHNPGESGYDGEPGLPGGPAGSFFGIGWHFVKGEYLSISANGGKGGRGQGGGDGRDGMEGKDCPSDICSVKEKVKLNIYLFYNERDDIFPGQNGGNGGDGGMGGVGGLKGSITLTDVGTKPRITKVKMTAHDGSEGEPGKGGSAGSGGRYYRGEIRSYVIVLTSTTKAMDQWANSGRSGQNGVYKVGRRDTWAANTSLRPMDVKRLCLIYLENNLSNHPKEALLKSFIDDIKKNDGLSLLNKRKRRFASQDDSEKSVMIRKGLDDWNNTLETPELENQIHLNKRVFETGTQVIKYPLTDSERKRHHDRKNIKDFDVMKEGRGNDTWLVETEERLFLTSGSNSLNKNSILNNIFVALFEGITSLKPWTLFLKSNQNGPNVDFHSSNIQSGNGGYSQPYGLHPFEQSSLVSLHGNLLLWDVVLKKLTGKRQSPPSSEGYGYEERVGFGSDLAYRHYIPTRSQV